MTKLRLLFTIAFVSIIFYVNAQYANLSGIIVKKSDNKPLLGTNVYLLDTNIGTATNAKGEYNINNIKPGNYTVIASFSGFKTIKHKITLKAGDNHLDFSLMQSRKNLDEVIVSRTKRENGETTAKITVPIKDAPVTVSIVDADIITQTQVNSINNAMRYSTGVKPTVNYGGFQTFKFRGLGRPVIIIDGAVDYRMVFSNSAPMTSLTAVERIEYLKGPASATYGHSADGGILHIIRKQPTKKSIGNFSTYYGSWHNKGATVDIGGKLSNKINYRFDAGLGDTKGWRDYAQKYSNIYGAIDYNINKKNKIEFRLGANDDFYATETGFPVFSNTVYNTNGKAVYKKGEWSRGFDTKQRYNDPQDFLKNKNINGGINFIHNFSKTSKLTIRSSYTYDYIDYFSTETLTFPTSDQAIFSHYYEKSGKRTYIDINNVKRSYPFRFAHQTNTFQSLCDYTTTLNTGSIKHNILIGYTLLLIDRITFSTNTKKDINGEGKNATISVVNPTLNQGNLNFKFSNARIYNELVNSIYAQDLLYFSSKIKALVALRFDYYDMNYQTATINTGKNLINKTDKINQTQTPITYRLGLVYEPINNLSFYTSYSNYFRPNRSAYSTNAIYLNQNGNEFNPTFFDPEKGYQAEIGFKYSFNNKLKFNSSAYYISKENIVEYVEQTSEGNPVYAQIGRAESKGIELDFVYNPIEGLKINTGYTLCDAKYLTFSIPKYTTDKKGNYLRRNPKNQFFIWSYYEIPKGILKNLNFGIGVNYTDKMYTNASNSYIIPSYWLTEATLGYTFNYIYLKLKINNILNEQYVSNSVMSNQFIPGQDRNYLFTIGYKF